VLSPVRLVSWVSSPSSSPRYMARLNTSIPRKYRPRNPVAPHVSFLPRVEMGLKKAACGVPRAARSRRGTGSIMHVTGEPDGAPTFARSTDLRSGHRHVGGARHPRRALRAAARRQGPPRHRLFRGTRLSEGYSAAALAGAAASRSTASAAAATRVPAKKRGFWRPNSRTTLANVKSRKSAAVASPSSTIS
jgi:hypothetical protein